MRSVAQSRFPIKKFANVFNSVTLVEISYSTKNKTKMKE